MGQSIACIAFKNKQIFVAKRHKVGVMGGKWEFPGGKIETGETPEIAIKRELREEFDVEVKVGKKIASTSFTHNNEPFTVEAYFVEFAHDGMNKPFTLTEHTEYKWIAPEEILELDFVDSDLKLYPEVMKYLNENEK